jgi:hypothetical protein
MKSSNRIPVRNNRSVNNGATQLDQLEKVFFVCPQRQSPLNLVIVYEDDQTREWAREAYERVMRMSGSQGVRPTWWKLSNLTEPGVLAGAVCTAARADVVVIAVRTTEGLPLPFYAWTSAWTTNRRQWGGVIIGIFGGDNMAKSSGRLGDYIQALARQMRMDCLLDVRSEANHHQLQRAATRTATLANFGRRATKSGAIAAPHCA